MKQLFLIIIFVVSCFGLFAQGTCPSSTPCSASTATYLDSVIYDIQDTVMYGSAFLEYDNNGSAHISYYEGKYINDAFGGGLYRFRVKAGNSYVWDSSPNYQAPDHTTFNTKFTLFYDDLVTPIIAQDGGGTGSTAKIIWRANYDGIVALLVTRGEQIYGLGECNVTSREDSVIIQYYCLERKSEELVYGRYADTITVCDQYIYDSGLNASGTYNIRNCYSDNEDGYTVIYSSDSASRLKLAGWYNLSDEDTLFVYDGAGIDNPLLGICVGLSASSTGENEAISFVSPEVNKPITLRMTSNGSDVNSGFGFHVICCLPPELPEVNSLMGEMLSDTSGELTWWPSRSGDIEYYWTLYSGSDSTVVDSGSTMMTEVLIDSLTCNINYFFSLRAYSVCLNEWAADTFWSAPFNYPYRIMLTTPGIYTDPPSICYGNNLTFAYSFSNNVNVGNTLTWTNNIGFQDTVGYVYENGTTETDIVTEDVYIYVVSQSDGGCVAQDNLYVQVIAHPELDITLYPSLEYGNISVDEHEICDDDSLQLRVTGALIYAWDAGFNTNVIAISPDTTTTYIVTGTDVNFCTYTDTFTVYVHPLPEVYVSGDTTNCLWDSVSLVSNGLDYSVWQMIRTITVDSVFVSDTLFQFNYNDSVLVSIDTLLIYDTITYSVTLSENFQEGYLNSVVISPTTDVTYYVSGVDSNGCVGQDYFYFEVKELPKVSLMIEDSSLCVGETTRIDVQSEEDYEYSWWVADNPEDIISQESFINVSPDSSERYFVQVFHRNGCDTIMVADIAVHSLPEVNASVYPSHVCARHTTTLIGIGDNLQFSWAENNTENPYYAYPDFTTTYMVTGTNIYGCTSTAEVTIIVDESPLHETVDDQNICFSNSVTLTLSNQVDNYQWYPATGLSSTTGNTVTASPTESTDYFVTYHTLNGCYDTTYFSVNIYHFPTPTICAENTICRGDSVLLTAGGGDFFVWDDEMNSTGDSIWVSPDSSRLYTVRTFDHPNCSSSADVNISVIPYFDLSISLVNDSICVGDNVTLIALGEATSYEWNTGDSTYWISRILDTSTIFSVSAYNATTGCSRTIEQPIVVMPLPTISCIVDDSVVCSFDTVHLSAIGDAASYYWNTGSFDTVITQTPINSTTYTVFGISSFGCRASASIDVAVNALPQISVLSINPSTICGNATSNIAAHISDPNITAFYWNNPEIDTTSYWYEYNPQYQSTIPYWDTISVTVLDVNGCRNTISNTIMVNPLPIDTIYSPEEICLGSSAVLSTNGTNYYYWYYPISTTFFQNVVAPTESTEYSVVITNSYMCSVTQSVTIDVNPLPDISVSTNNDYSYYCNNQEYQLHAEGAETYVWNNGSTGGEITITPEQTYSYQVTGTDANGCSSLAFFPITVIQSPTLQISAFPDTTICAFDTLLLSAFGNVTLLEWNNDSTMNVLEINDLEEETSFSVIGTSITSGTPCYAYDTIHINVNEIPTLSILQNSSPICANRTGDIIIDGADSYVWNSHPTLNVISEDSVHIVPTSIDSAQNILYQVTGRYNETGCQTTMEIPFIISIPPMISIESSTTGNAICEGDTLHLIADGGVVFRWFEVDNPLYYLSETAQLNIIPEENTTYSVYVENQAQCFDYDSIAIVINPNPIFEVSTAEAICYGFSTQLTVDGNADIYSWIPAAMWNNDVGDTATVAPVMTTDYQIIATDTTTGCITLHTASVLVNNSPEVSITNENSLCYGETLLLNANGANDYIWFYDSVQNVFQHPFDTITVHPLDLPYTVYGVIGTDNWGCKDTITTQIYVNAIPEITINVASPGYLCYGNDNYIGMTAQSNVSGMSYTWTSSTGNESFTSWEEMALAFPDTTTLYTVTGSYSQHGASCMATEDFELIVYPRPVINATATPDTVCPNTPVVLSAGGAERFIWSSPNIGTIGIGANQTVYPESGVPYIVLGEDDNRCTNRDTVWVEILDISASFGISDNYVCENTPTELSLTGDNINYEWIPNVGLSNLSNQSVTATLDSNMLYQVIITNQYGCTGTVEVPINVHPTPNLILSNDTVICHGMMITLEAEGGTSYYWDDGSTNNNRDVAPEITTSYAVTAFNHYDCFTVKEVEVEVIPNFDLEIRVSQDSFCLGERVTLTAYGAGDRYLWNNGVTDSVITVSPTETTTYSVTAFNNSVRCYHNVEYTLYMREQPQIAFASDSVHICIHDTAQLAIIADKPYRYVWNDGFQDTLRTLVPSFNLSFSVTATDIHGCASTDEVQLYVHPLPSVRILCQDSILCYGESVNLSVAGDADSYLWNDIYSTEQLTITPTNSANYAVIATSVYGCESADSMEVIVNPNPMDSVIISENNVCPGDSVTLSASGTNTYQWFLPNAQSLSTDSLVVINPLSTTIYNCVYTNQFGCKDSIQTEVEVRPLPISEVIGDTVMCIDSEIRLHITGNNSYLWSTQDTSNTITISPTENTTYYVTSTNWYNCSKVDSITVRLKPLFVMEIHSSIDTICPGDSVTFALYGAGDNYLWSTGSSEDTIMVAPEVTTTYSLTGHNNSTQCDKTIYHTIEVKPIPEFNINAPTASICTDDSIVLAVSVDNVEYEWNTGDVSQSITVSPLENSFYAVTATAPNNCTFTNSFNLAVNERPFVDITASDTVVCAGNTISLNAVGNGNHYRWNNGYSGTTLNITQTAVTQYSVTAFSVAGCTSSDSIQVAIHPNPIDFVTISQNNICPGDTIVLNTSGLNNYIWSPAASLSSANGQNVNAFPNQTTTYKCLFTNEFGCKDSATVNILVRPGPNIQLTPNTTICLHDEITLTVNGGISYLWSTGNTNTSFSVAPTTTTSYTVTVTNQYDCSAAETVVITVFDPFMLSINSAQDTICHGETLQLSVYGAADQYLWNTGSTNQVIEVSPTQNSIYSVTGFNNATSCELTVYDTITVIQYPVFNVSTIPIICQFDTLSISIETEDFQDIMWYCANSESILSALDEDSIIVSPSETSTYIYSVTNRFCTLIDSIVIETTPLPQFEEIEVYDDRCTQGIGYISLEIASPYLPVEYLWNDGNENQNLSNLFEGLYHVTVTDALGCRNSMNNIQVENLPPPTFETVAVNQQYCDFGGSIEVQATSYTGNYHFSWFADSLNGTSLPTPTSQEIMDNLDSGIYWTLLTDDHCSVSQQNYVPFYCSEQVEYYIPNAFTPNDDINNIWRPYIPNLETNGYSYELYIYNRWGGEIFHSTSIEEGWNGKFNGKSVTIGSYVFIIFLKDKYGQTVNHTPIKGVISVL